MIRETSLDAYFYIRGNGIDLNQRGKIYAYLMERKTPATRLETSVALGIPINAVTGRVNEMIESGHVIEYVNRKCRISGRIVTTIEARR